MTSTMVIAVTWPTSIPPLGAVEQSHRTAQAIIAFPVRGFDRGNKILVLKLLTLGIDGQTLDL